MHLKPKMKFRIRQKQDEKTYDVSILSIVNDINITVLLDEEFNDLVPGNKVRIEIPQKGDALYVSVATISKIMKKKNTVCILKDISEPVRFQRRRSERIPVTIKAEYSVQFQEEVEEGLILDISESGVLMAVKRPLTVGSQLLLIFELPFNADQVPVGVMGIIIREQKDFVFLNDDEYSYAYGIQFKNLPRNPINI